ncbi:restriction endonuclease subunit S [Dickeya dadantii]|nr:restriction endonuclease subunit S [Dickeya dadantii]
MRMNKQKKGLVPELRFPEFEKEPNWPCVKLNAVAKRSTSKNKGEKITRVLTNSAVEGVVDQRDYFDKDIAVKGNLESYYIVDKGDYVYNPRISSVAPVGPVSKNKVGKGVMSPLYTIFRFNSKSNDFFEQFFKSSRWYGYLQTVSNSGARHDRMSITNSEFMAMPVPNPSDMEQQKIADCLASVDELIALQTQKLDALNAHKKGLMQQIFPAEGETVPKLRFSEFKDSGEWKSKPLGKVSSFFKGKGIAKSDTSIGGSLPCIRYGELYTHYNETIDDVISYTNIPANELVLSNENDVIIPASGETQEDIATASCVLIGGVALGGDLNIIRSSLNGVFLSYYLNNAKKLDIAKMAQGISVVHLYPSQLKNLEIIFPEIVEQEKIASFFAVFDGVIKDQKSRIEYLKKHKKSLIQKLFPAMDEADL